MTRGVRSFEYLNLSSVPIIRGDPKRGPPWENIENISYVLCRRSHMGPGRARGWVSGSVTAPQRPAHGFGAAEIQNFVIFVSPSAPFFLPECSCAYNFRSFFFHSCLRVTHIWSHVTSFDLTGFFLPNSGLRIHSITDGQF